MFKIGDKVKVLPGQSYGHCIEIGCVAEVIGECTVGRDGSLSVTVIGQPLRKLLGETVEQVIDPSELELWSADSIHLTDEEIQAIDDSTHFHESFDWSIRFARSVLKAAEEKKNG